jgi:Raf kinase inhibitor-like YbhB/YbcL family protein
MWIKERKLMKFGKPIAILLIVCFVASLAATTVSSKGSTGSKGDKNMAIQNIKVFSSAFESNSTIPKKYTCSGENINPPLELGGIPKEAKSLVLIVEDPDAPMKVFTHWIVWNIAPIAKINENSIPGVEGINDFRKIGYGGPCPPSGTHMYFFRVYALDKQLGLKAGTSRKELESDMREHIIAEGEFMGKYSKT